MDKSDWGPGPWQVEPDKLQWIDETTGLDCLVVRNRYGALCGYVGVPPGHPAHGCEYDVVDVDVHGGLTYAAGCQEDAEEASSICHVPAPGRPDDVWWLGFDCGHLMDRMPGLEARERELSMVPPFPGRSYRTIAYVREECARLAEQLKEARRA